MALRTRQWGCALGITLLIAVPVVLAVWLGQVLTRTDRLVNDVLQNLPVYRGAYDARYDFAPDFGRRFGYSGWEKLEYRVDEESQRVLDYYREVLSSEGWAEVHPYGYPLSAAKFHHYVNGLRFQERPPWIHVKYGSIPLGTYIEAQDKRSNGRSWSEVTIFVGPLTCCLP